MIDEKGIARKYIMKLGIEEFEKHRGKKNANEEVKEVEMNDVEGAYNERVARKMISLKD